MHVFQFLVAVQVPASSHKGATLTAMMRADAEPGCWLQFQRQVRLLKLDVVALYYAVHDSRTPLISKVLPWLVSRNKVQVPDARAASQLSPAPASAQVVYCHE